MPHGRMPQKGSINGPEYLLNMGKPEFQMPRLRGYAGFRHGSLDGRDCQPCSERIRPTHGGCPRRQPWQGPEASQVPSAWVLCNSCLEVSSQHLSGKAFANLLMYIAVVGSRSRKLTSWYKGSTCMPKCSLPRSSADLGREPRRRYSCTLHIGHRPRGQFNV